MSSTHWLLLFPLLLVGCGGSALPPTPPAPAEAGVAPHYERAYAALRVHPAVQAFAAEHLDPSETLAIEVSNEVVPLVPAAHRALGDSLSALSGALSATDDALPALSRHQRHPLVLFFGARQGDHLAAQLYPNPYRRSGFEAISDGAPGLALLVAFEGNRVAEVHSGLIGPD